MRRFALYLGVISLMATKACTPAYSDEIRGNPRRVLNAQEMLFKQRMSMANRGEKNNKLPVLNDYEAWANKQVEKPVQPLPTNAPYMSSEQIRIRKYWTDRQTNSLPR